MARIPDFLRATNPPAVPAATADSSRLRFTVRQMMVVVPLTGALAGVALWGASLLWVSVEYQVLAEKHAALAQSAPGRVSVARVGGKVLAEWWSPSREYHLRMKKKYEQAAAEPWIPVEPDPPEPEPRN
jgi:hypothetical protein